MFLIEKNSIVIMTPASAGLCRYYEHILKNMDTVLKTKSPSDEDLDKIEMEGRDEHENLVAEEDLEDINLKAIQIIEGIRNDYQNQSSIFVISGCLGPQGDGYNATEKLNKRESQTYQIRQIETFAKSNADW